MTNRELIAEAIKKQESWKVRLLDAVREYALARDVVKGNSVGFQSIRRASIETFEYDRDVNRYTTSLDNLWKYTDIEYSDDPIRQAAWEWRHAKVMSRKCCFYQGVLGETREAGHLMEKLTQAEQELMKECGISDYKIAEKYIEDQFPNLK